MDLIQMANREKKKIKEVIDNSKDLIKHLPKGSLTIEKREGHFYYKRNVSGFQKYLRRKDPRVPALKDKYLLEHVLDSAEFDLKVINEFLGSYRSYDPNYIQDTLPDGYKKDYSELVRSLGFMDGKRLKEYVNLDPRYPEALTQKAEDGRLVRSKSELNIISIYNKKGIAAGYEVPLVFPDGTRIDPDFTVWVDSKQKYMYHEHIGKLGDPAYLDQQVWKLRKFLEYGYYPFSDVIYTFDDKDGNIDVELIDELIELTMR